MLIETGLAERPDIVEEDPSPLATKLLSHWAHGSLSAKAIQELAHLSQLGGTSHEEVSALAKAGNYGSNPGNVHKAIMQAFLPNVGIPPGFNVEVPCRPQNQQGNRGNSQHLPPSHHVCSTGRELPSKVAGALLHRETRGILGGS